MNVTFPKMGYRVPQKMAFKVLLDKHHTVSDYLGACGGINDIGIK